MILHEVLGGLTRGGRGGLVGVVALVGLVVGGVPVAAGPIDVPGWDLVWQDEFDQPSPDTSEWELFDLRNSFNNELQYYRPEQITTRDGNLVITATDQPLDGKQYRSGRMESWQEWGFGRFEARIKLPTGQGYWPAFWLLPETDTTPWPTGGEIDILENRGSQPHLVSSAYHYNNVPNFSNFRYDEYAPTNPDGSPAINFHESFNDFAVEWEADEMRFFVNGVNYHTLTGTQVPIYDTPKKIVLNLAVGGFFGGNPDATTPFPAEMLVDYVRVWQRPDGGGGPVDPPASNLLTNGNFDDGGGSLLGWSTFGVAGENVSANNALRWDGGHALKLFGQFTGETNFSGVTQSVAVTEGVSLIASALAQTPSWDSIAGSGNDVTLKIEFYDRFGGVFGSDDQLGEVELTLFDGASPEDEWVREELEAVAPEGAVEARVVLVLGQRNNAAGAVWIDGVTLAVVEPSLVGDYDGDGFVSQADLNLVLLNWGESVLPAEWTATDQFDGEQISQNELNAVLLNWGSGTAPVLNAAAIPEPTSAVGIGLLSAGLFGVRRRR